MCVVCPRCVRDNYLIAMYLRPVSVTFRCRLIGVDVAFYMTQLRFASACQAVSCFVVRTPVEAQQDLWQLQQVDGSIKKSASTQAKSKDTEEIFEDDHHESNAKVTRRKVS